MKLCRCNTSKLTLLTSRYTEMRRLLTAIASKCSILLTRQPLKYANLTPLYVSEYFVQWLFLSDHHCFPHQRVINRWCMAFLILFEEGLRNLRDAQLVSQGPIDNWVPIGGEIVERSLARKIGRERRKLEGLDLGMQELRTYFRLFMLSTFLLMFMFCSRISNNNRQTGNIFSS